ncbi:hypothetical protein scyTo_0018556, partial [Scyliorhinus torazame]|nr:hypothetical protein [Scyliorhinus torazame]
LHAQNGYIVVTRPTATRLEAPALLTCAVIATGMSSETEDQVLREAEEQLLHLARNGVSEEVTKLLDRRRVENLTFNINCKGRTKSNFGWTPLHLACYFGHKDVVEELLKADADVNVVNDIGDSPLHRAAFTGRKELVMLLLQCDADAAVINGDGQTARAVTQDQEIRCMLEAAEMTQRRKSEELLLAAAREGDVAGLTTLVSRVRLAFPSPNKEDWHV